MNTIKSTLNQYVFFVNKSIKVIFNLSYMGVFEDSNLEKLNPNIFLNRVLLIMKLIY